MTRVLRARHDDDGFTLIELLVVVIIIGILAAIAIPVFLNQQQKAYDAAAKSDIYNAAQAEEDYFAANGQYADISTVASSESYKPSSGTTIVSIFVNAKQGYCLGAYQSSGSPLPQSEQGLQSIGVTNVVWWWDSNAGGLQPENAPLDPTNYGCPDVNPGSGASVGYGNGYGFVSG